MKRKNSIFNIFEYISGFTVGFVSVFWAFIILISTFSQGTGGNYDGIKEYALMSLTLSGFTLLGGIFEKREDEEQPVVKHLFKISIIFLMSFICLLFAYGVFPLISPETIIHILIAGVIFIIGVFGFAIAILYLWFLLIEYYLKKYSIMD